MGKRINIEIFLNRVKQSNPTMYSTCDYSDTIYKGLNKKVSVKCINHGLFEVWPGDHMRGLSGCKQCITDKRKKTLQEKYGVDNYFKRGDLVVEAMLRKHGVKNPGLMKDHISKMISTNKEKYGVAWSAVLPEVSLKRKATNTEKYGFEFPMQNKEVSSRMVSTKVKTGKFSKSNSSMNATKFILKYIKYKGYELEQCAFDYTEHGLYEWGYFYKGRWRLYDLVVFNKGHRGNKNEIIEILEYHGPFHYTKSDAHLNGDKKAYPWKSNRTTIYESVETDKIKKELALILTSNFNVIWERDINPNDVIAENVNKLESRYPGGKFDPFYSENRKPGDL